MNVLQIIGEWKKGCSVSQHEKIGGVSEPVYCVDCTRAAMVAIEQAERHRLKLEAEYTPTKPYKIGKVNLSNAVVWCLKNGQPFHVDSVGGLWVVVRLTPIHVGLLKQIHIEGIPYEPTEPVVHDTSEPDAIDYERIG